MPPAKSSSNQSDSPPPEKKYLPLWLDGDDSSLPPPSKGTRNGTSVKSASSKVKSKKARKRKNAPKAQPTAPQPEANSEDEAIDLNGPVVDYFSREHSVPEPTTPVARTQVRRCSRPESENDSADKSVIDNDASDADVSQDGRGDPNMSAISPPLPFNLVEPQLRGHETGFHVVTAGTEVGISVFRGIAESLLDCRNASMATFSTWASARDYYSECFDHASIHIREARGAQTPIQSPVRKKQKRTAPSRLPQAEALTQPHFAPAMNQNPGVQVTTSDLGTANNVVEELARSINSRYLREKAAAHSPIDLCTPKRLAPANPLSLCERVPAPSPIDLCTPPKRLALANPLSLCERVPAPSPIDLCTPPKHLAPANLPSSPPIFRPRVIVIDSSSEEDLPASAISTKQERSNPNAAFPIASSSCNPPTSTREDSTVIIVSDSEEEELRFPDSDMERELNKLNCVQKPGPPPRGHRRF